MNVCKQVNIIWFNSIASILQDLSLIIFLSYRRMSVEKIFERGLWRENLSKYTAHNWRILHYSETIMVQRMHSAYHYFVQISRLSKMNYINSTLDRTKVFRRNICTEPGSEQDLDRTRSLVMYRAKLDRSKVLERTKCVRLNTWTEPGPVLVRNKFVV